MVGSSVVRSIAKKQAAALGPPACPLPPAPCTGRGGRRTEGWGRAGSTLAPTGAADKSSEDKAMHDEDLCLRPAVDLADDIRSHRLSPVELAQAVLARIEALKCVLK